MAFSIRRQLYWRLGTLLLLLWLTVVVCVAWVVKHETEEVFDSNLQETAQRLLFLTRQEIALARSPQAPPPLESPPHEEYLRYQLFDREGRLLRRSHQAPPRPMVETVKPGFHDAGQQRIYVETSPDGQYTIQVAEQAEHRQETLESILTYLLLPLLGLLPLAGMAIFRVVQGAERPIRRFEAEISRRGGHDLSPLQPDLLPVELAGVAQSVNRLLERLRQALEGERSFAANSAHELRTPVAAAMAQLQVLQEHLDEPQARERVGTALAMLERLQRITVKLLQLARVESGVALNKERFDLRMLTEMLCRDYSFTGKHPLHCHPAPAPVWVCGDIDALGIALQNLLENADRHAPAGTAVEVSLESDGRLTVSNDCAPIPPQQLADLKQRFVRATQETPGTGLGLAIVEAIARQSGGSLELHSPLPGQGRGFIATLCLPLSPSAQS